MITAQKVALTDIQSLRALFLQENNFQIRYNACHERGWSDSYLIGVDGRNVGYGSVKGQEIQDRDTIFEFFVIQPFRRTADELFRHLLSTSGATLIECQSNDLLLSSMIYEFSPSVSAEVMLFKDYFATEYVLPGAIFRQRHERDSMFEHKIEPVGDYVIAIGGDIVATGGFMTHYNPPFADLYMEVREDYQRRNIATFLLQELKTECYASGRVPAARCNLRNFASRAALLKAGLRTCGFMLMGSVDPKRL